MAKNLQIFKGGFAARSRDADGNLRESRLVANQRPADGHIKPSGYEDYIRVDKHRNWRRATSSVSTPPSPSASSKRGASPSPWRNRG